MFSRKAKEKKVPEVNVLPTPVLIPPAPEDLPASQQVPPGAPSPRKPKEKKAPKVDVLPTPVQAAQAPGSRAAPLAAGAATAAAAVPLQPAAPVVAVSPAGPAAGQAGQAGLLREAPGTSVAQAAQLESISPYAMRTSFEPERSTRYAAGGSHEAGPVAFEEVWQSPPIGKHCNRSEKESNSSITSAPHRSAAYACVLQFYLYH